MTAFTRITTLAIGAAMLAIAGCKTEVNNAPPPGGDDHTTVIHEHPDNSGNPPVQNNIHVDR